jgi:hypothetical protein
MKNFFYIPLIILIFSSCLKEHDIFYPYKKDKLTVLESLRGENQYLVFKNSNGLEFTDGNGLVIQVDKNSFNSESDSIILQWRQINSNRKIIADRLSMIEKSNYLISPATIIDFKFKDKKGNEIFLVQNKFINFSIPDTIFENLSIFRYDHYKWIFSKSGQDLISKHSWTVEIEGISVNKNGYLFKTQTPGIISLGKYLDKNWKSNEVLIDMHESYNVGNSVVQMVFPDLKFNIELEWDNEKRAFKIPENFLLPDNKLNIIVLSEDDNHNPYFGMKYAEITDDHKIKVEVFKSKIEDIKDILDKI